MRLSNLAFKWPVTITLCAVNPRRGEDAET